MNNEDLAARRLLLVASALGTNVSDLWAVYQELYNHLDLDDPNINDMMYGLLAEMESNLTDVLDQVAGQIYNLTGVWEPVPSDTVEDFEASVLRSISSLDTINLEEYRVRYDD